MMIRDNLLVSLWTIVALLQLVRAMSTHHHDSYTAAVYEHRRIEPETAGSPMAAVRANLEYYGRAARVASQQGADIIVFPEYGLFPASGNRSEIKQYLEAVPDPKEVSANPCYEPDRFADRPTLRTLSCIAEQNNIVVVANMGGLERCEGDPKCPDDGQLQFNTNVAFDKNGMLLARYYKEHLYFELSMDLPRVEQDPVFDAKFAKFAMFICFDIVFEKMALTSRLQDVDAVIFSTMWFTGLPFYASTQLYQSWAMGNNATMLAANIQKPGHSLSGSGIFRGRKGSVVHNYNPDGISKLMVATLPKRGSQDVPSNAQSTAILESGTGEVRAEGTDVPPVCSFAVLGETENVYTEYRCFNEIVSNYTLVKLSKTEDRISACNAGMCCELDYVASSMDESFYLGIFNGTHAAYQTYFWAEENCFLARCDDVNGTQCSNFLPASKTLFHKVSLKANFTTDFVYPSFMSSGLRLVPADDWRFDTNTDTSSIRLNSNEGVPLILATLKGRPYYRDPPYVR